MTTPQLSGVAAPNRKLTAAVFFELRVSTQVNATRSVMHRARAECHLFAAAVHEPRQL